MFDISHGTIYSFLMSANHINIFVFLNNLSVVSTYLTLPIIYVNILLEYLYLTHKYLRKLGPIEVK